MEEDNQSITPPITDLTFNRWYFLEVLLGDSPGKDPWPVMKTRLIDHMKDTMQDSYDSFVKKDLRDFVAEVKKRFEKSKSKSWEAFKDDERNQEWLDREYDYDIRRKSNLLLNDFEWGHLLAAKYTVEELSEALAESLDDKGRLLDAFIVRMLQKDPKAFDEVDLGLDQVDD